MKKIIILGFLSVLSCGIFAQQNKTSKFQQDKDAIKAMVGCYKVSFDFAETFAPDTAYKYHERHSSWGIEYVFIAEETDKKIVLQHLLIINDSTIIKHWRQDWIYENTELYAFQTGSEWKRINITAEQAKGTWTQRVFQVDDSPRYEGYGTWNHVDGRHFWESTTDSPLPRREFTKRSDYNVVKRHSRYELTSYGWIYEQDNEKIVRNNGSDQLLVWEKGFEKFTTGNHNCQPAIDWWNKNQNYWNDVRKVWDEVFAATPNLKFQKRVNDKLLFEQLFSLGDKYAEVKKYNSSEAKAEIKSTITAYLIK